MATPMNNTGNAVGSTDPRDLIDNAQVLDGLVNGDAAEVTARTGKVLKSWEGMQSDSDARIAEIDSIITSLDSAGVITVPTVAAGLAATTNDQYFRVPQGQGGALAFVYYSNAAGNAQKAATIKNGDEYLSISKMADKAEWLHNFTITGDSTQAFVTVNNLSTTSGICVLYPVEPGQTLYIGMAVSSSNNRFRMLDLPSYPYNGMQRPGSRYSWTGAQTPAWGTIDFDGQRVEVRQYVTASDAKYILIYQALDSSEEVPVVFSKDGLNFSYLRKFEKYQVENQLEFTAETYETVKNGVKNALNIHVVGNQDTASRMVGYGIVEGSPRPILNSSNAEGGGLRTWVVPSQAGKRYTVIMKREVSDALRRFRVGAFTRFPSRRDSVNSMFNGLTAGTKSLSWAADDGVMYIYVTFDTVTGDNFLALNLAINGDEPGFAVVEGGFIPGVTHKALKEVWSVGVPTRMPIAHIGQLTSDIIGRGKNLFDGNFINGYATDSDFVTTDYSVVLSSTRQHGDATYADVVSAIIPVKPGTKYTVSRSGGSRFRLGVAQGFPSANQSATNVVRMKQLTVDSALNSFTLTTGPSDTYIFVYLSNTGGVKWLQVEEGGVATAPETFGWKFKPAAEAIQQAITTTSGYIEAGAGDGVTDDSDALITAIGLAVGLLSFNPAKKYLLKKTLPVKASAFTGLYGNGATFIMDGDFPAFTITGSMTAGSANPASNGPLARSEGGFLLDRVRAYSVSRVSGTGVLLSGMFKPRIQNCDLMYLKNGIQFSGLNRDVIISNNHVYACHDYGVYFDDTADIHQLNILGNIITYCTKNIFLDNADIYNLQIVGNDIELGTYPADVNGADKADIWINAFNGALVEDVSVVGNTLEDHWTSQQLVYMSGESTASILSVDISGNSAGNSSGVDLRLGGCAAVAVTGQFKKTEGYVLDLIGPVSGLQMTVQAHRAGTSGGLLHADGISSIRDLNLSGCQLSGTAEKAVKLVSVGTLRNVMLSNNCLRDKSASGSVEIDADSIIGLRADSNQIDNSESTASVAMKITARSVSGKNSMMNNSATKGVFTAPGGFVTTGNF